MAYCLGFIDTSSISLNHILTAGALKGVMQDLKYSDLTVNFFSKCNSIMTALK